jgi:tRNA(Ile)-lysidine synthase
MENVPELAAGRKKWVVAVSGGADSMCLTLLVSEFAASRNIHLFACFVDHRLKKNSERDIEFAIETLQSRGNFDCHVLSWQHGENLGGNIELKARNARYALLLRFCREKGVDCLLTAHHSLDQWETFFMRLSRGSALRGLSCIMPISLMEDVFVIRPFLNYSPSDIKETLVQRFGISEYFHDPMNEQTQFERVRWRRAYPILATQFNLGMEGVNKSIDRLRQSEEYLEQAASALTDQIFDGEYIYLSKFREQHVEMRMRILRMIIKRQIISYDLLKRTAIRIIEDDFKAINLGGIVILKDKTKNLKIKREKRKQFIISTT